MPVQNEDLRSIKTEKALNDAMFSLLGRRSFRKITVRDICKESLISRATFYAHFTDKYNFLSWWMKAAWPDNMIHKDDTYEVMEQKINQYVIENKTIIKNLFMDLNGWTLDALFDAFHFILHLTIDKTNGGLDNSKYIVLSNFYIGGMIHYLMWQVKHDFPQNVTTMNEYLFELMKTFEEWN